MGCTARLFLRPGAYRYLDLGITYMYRYDRSRYMYVDLRTAGQELRYATAAVCPRRSEIENFNALKSCPRRFRREQVYTPSTVVPMGMQTGFRGLFAAFAVNHRI